MSPGIISKPKEDITDSGCASAMRSVPENVHGSYMSDQKGVLPAANDVVSEVFTAYAEEKFGMRDSLQDARLGGGAAAKVHQNIPAGPTFP
ncbi:hypothetical protein DdX_12311 [Ditylenchus destructor]|uniref:Uncharacterized protein n=1 Tax=Ditylenchus destructor TaxID=166010 RepID=A0AAD4QXI3_9BILA|nr:hypothetical protein DdX_12311 [Ditylenchus destructor]